MAIPIDVNEINVSKLNSAVSALEALKENLQKQVEDYIEALGICTDMAQDVSSILKDKIDISTVTEYASDFVEMLDSQINDILLKAKKSVNEYGPQITEFRNIALIVLYSLGAFMAVLFLVAILIILRLAYLAWRLKLFSAEDDLGESK